MGYLICFGEIVRWIGFGLLLGNTNTQNEEHKGRRDKNWEGEKNTPPLSFARPIEGLRACFL